MLTREAMQSLGQEIICSYEDRIKRIAEIRTGVKSRLKELDAAHKAMSKELRANLAKFRSALTEEEKRRRSQVHELRNGFQEELAGVRKEWGEQLSALQAKKKSLKK